MAGREFQLRVRDAMRAYAKRSLAIFLLSLWHQICVADSLPKETFLLFEGDGRIFLDAKYLDDVRRSHMFPVIHTARQVDSSLVSQNKPDITTYNKYIEPQYTSFEEYLKNDMLIPFRAKSVDHKKAWLWGNYVLLAGDYALPQKTIAWRSDFKCPTVTRCKFAPKLLDQLFELSYLIVKDGPKPHRRAVDSRDYVESSVVWGQPEEQPRYNVPPSRLGDNTFVWTLQLKKIDLLIKKERGNWQGGQDVVADSLARLLDRFASDKYSYFNDTASQPVGFDRRKFGYYRHDVVDGKQKRLKFVYEEQLSHYIGSWDHLKLIGYIEVDGRGFIYFKPYVFRKGKKIAPESVPVVVFEYRRRGRDLKIVPGVATDLMPELLTNPHILDSLRLSQPIN